jgi:hypothetical protein
LAWSHATLSQGVGGSGSSVACSRTSNTVSGAAPVVPCVRGPATSSDQRRAAARICASVAKSRPVKKLLRAYWTVRSTRGLSLGWATRAGSMTQPS